MFGWFAFAMLALIYTYLLVSPATRESRLVFIVAGATLLLLMLLTLIGAFRG